MDSLITLACLVAGGWWLFRHGKRLGSRRAFGVGFKRARRRFNRRRHAVGR